MPSARDILRQAQLDRPESASLAEESDRAASAQVLEATPKANTADGVIVSTTNGGELTVFNGAQGVTPELNGQSYQVQLSGGSARLVVNSKAATVGSTTQQPTDIVATRPPAATDAGQPGQLWLDISPEPSGGVPYAIAYAYIRQLGAYALISAAATAIQSGNGPPSTEFTGTPADQNRYYDRDVNRYWTYNTDTWKPDSFLSLLATPAATVTDSLVAGDQLIVDVYQFVWDGTDWRKAYCCDEGPEEPPVSGKCGEGEVYWWPNCPSFNDAFDQPQYTCVC